MSIRETGEHFRATKYAAFSRHTRVDGKRVVTLGPLASQCRGYEQPVAGYWYSTSVYDEQDKKIPMPPERIAEYGADAAADAMHDRVVRRIAGGSQ